jgi:Cu/Ag efflux pump CusA
MIEEAKSGPPTGADLEVQIAGEDFTTLDKILTDLKPIILSIPGAINISTSRQAVPFEYLIEFDHNKLALYNLTVPQVASFLREAIDGVETTKIFRGSDEIVVRTRMAQNEVKTLNAIKNLKIKNQK